MELCLKKAQKDLTTIKIIADKIVVGGAMGTTFNYALGLPVGNSLYEPESILSIVPTGTFESFESFWFESPRDSFLSLHHLISSDGTRPKMFSSFLIFIFLHDQDAKSHLHTAE